MPPTPVRTYRLPAQHSALPEPDLLGRVRDLAPVVAAGVTHAEREGELAPAVLAGLRGAGVFRMAYPRSRGGLEADPLMQLAVVEELARHDASAGWVAMIGSDGGYYSAFLEPDVGSALFGDVDAVTAGYVMPAGIARVEGGGWMRVDGRWPFASGSAHARVFASGVMVEGRSGSDPAWRVAVLERSDIDVQPTWDAIGLRGTSSHHYTGTDVAVPSERTFSFAEPPHVDGPLYRFPGMFLVNVSGVPLGVARAALDDAYRVVDDKQRPAGTSVRDEPRVQAALARAEGCLGAARCLVHDAVGALWSALVAGNTPTLRQRAQVWIATAHAFSAARDVVGSAVEVAGSTACYASSPLQRHLRDITAMCAHAMAQPRTLETAGRMLLGEEPPVPVL